VSGLAISVWREGGRIANVRVASRRPDPARLLPGRAPADAVALLGTLYSVCGHAQRAAGELALAAAEGRGLAPATRAKLHAAVAGEAAQEHLWRLLVDWPRRLGLPVDQAAFAGWYRRCGAAGADWAGPLVEELAGWAGGAALLAPRGAREPLVVALERFAELSAADAWIATGDTPFARCLRELRVACRGADRPRRPAADETGAYPRLADHPWVAALAAAGRGLEARVVARYVALVELAASLAAPARGERPDEALEFDADGPRPGVGRAVVSTARGLLLHEARLEAGVIREYAIRTPTDRNFAPNGAYARAVAGLACGDDAEAERLAGLWALALDPCVPFAVRATGEVARA